MYAVGHDDRIRRLEDVNGMRLDDKEILLQCGCDNCKRDNLDHLVVCIRKTSWYMTASLYVTIIGFTLFTIYYISRGDDIAPISGAISLISVVILYSGMFKVWTPVAIRKNMKLATLFSVADTIVSTSNSEQPVDIGEKIVQELEKAGIEVKNKPVTRRASAHKTEQCT